MGFLLRRVIDRFNGHVETEEYRLDLVGLRTSAGQEAKVFVTQTFDAPSAPFTVAPGVSIPIGEYRDDAIGASFLTHASRPVSIEGQILTGRFYDGEQTSGNFTLRVRPVQRPVPVGPRSTPVLAGITVQAPTCFSSTTRRGMAVSSLNRRDRQLMLKCTRLFQR